VRFVFGFDMLDATTPVLTFNADQVYTGTAVIARQFTNEYDYCVVRVDRAITVASSLPLRREGAVAVGTQVGVIGHPWGLPKKIAFGAHTLVRANNADGYFTANLDTYARNTGSPVFNEAESLVEGIFVRGNVDFIIESDCFRSNVLPDDTIDSEAVSKSVTFAGWVYGDNKAPQNDSCENALPINVDETKTGSTVGATGTGQTSCSGNDYADVWFSFTPPVSGNYVVSLCGSDYDTTLALFSGFCASPQDLACNEDSDSCGPSSQLCVNLTLGDFYLIRVSGYDGAAGNYQLNITSSDSCDSIEGEGEVLPEGEGEILPEGEGEILSEGEGEILLEGEGEILPEGEGEVPPEGEGECLFEVGARVVSIVDYPDGSPCIVAGTSGTLVCEGFSNDWLVSWDGIGCGHNGFGECGVDLGTSGWWAIESEMEVICGSAEGEGEVLPEGEGECLFAIGARVAAIVDHPDDSPCIVVGTTGTIVCALNGSNWLVAWDDMACGHNGFGLCDLDLGTSGWAVSESEIEVLCGPAEGELPPEGEGEVLIEGEGEPPVEGEGECLFEVGARVVAIVDHPQDSPCIVKGNMGTIVCELYGPDWLVQWDYSTCGHNGYGSCGLDLGTSGWAVDEGEIALICGLVEGEGEVLPEGEGEVLPEGEGEVLPEGEGEVLPEGEGEVLPEGEGEVLPEGEGEVLPEGEGEVLPEGEGEVLPEGEGEVLPEGEGEVLPEGEGEVLPEGEGEVLPEGEGEVLPEGEGEVQPEGEGEVQPEGEGEVLPEGEGEVQPEGEGEVLPEGEGEVLPEGEGEVLPEGEGEVLPEGEGEVLPEGEGEVLPEGEGEVLPEGEGEVLTEGEGEVPAEGEGEVLTEGEGEVLAEGEGEVLAEGEGEVLAEGEGEVLPEGEGEVLPEGEGEVLPEGEGEIPAEGEPENNVVIRNVLDMSSAEAQSILAASGLQVTQSSACDNDVPVGSVISQSPVGGTPVPSGSTVTLVVSSGPCEEPPCGCCSGGAKFDNPGDAIKRMLGDWLLVGLSLAVLLMLSTAHKR